MINAYKKYWTNFFNFSDRTSRKDFWLTILMIFIVNICFSLVISLIFGHSVDFSQVKTVEELMEVLKDPAAIISLIWTIANIIPGLAMDVRRMHDINKSGWFIFITLIPLVGGIIYLVWLCTASVDNDNNYGSQV